MFKILKSGLSTLCALLIANIALAGERPGFLLINAKVTDFEKLGAYDEALSTIYTKYDVQHVIDGRVGRGVEVLAGNTMHNSLTLVRFDNLKVVEKFWSSEDYRAVVPLRDAAGRFDVLGLEGTGEEPYAATNGAEPAYLFTLLKVKNREKIKDYIEAVSDYAATGPHKVIAVSRPGESIVLEGLKQESTIEISSWPSLATIRDFISDPRFAGLSDLRNEAMDFLLLAAEVPKAPN